ncbi:MAG: selenide, water dikinase SelD [Bdellovibrionales bacterium]|nr:selenide, water dikinase SelD [Bdellovibrionales bacterium]
MKLTQSVAKGGCAAKVAATELRRILSRVKFPPSHRDLLVDGGLFDDAAIYQVKPDLALVQTVDFFTPIVDTPRRFGRIAAANALSDVYAMGGTPRTAMAVLAFPLAAMEESVCVDVLQGACEVLEEAETCLVGGHSIDDDTLKFGLSVTGYVHPDRVWTNAGAKPGDALILTKALGTGTVTAALKRQHITEDAMEEVLRSMEQINRVLDLLPGGMETAIHAATDVTGFGLAGHSMQMALASRVTLRMRHGDLPRFSLVDQCLEFLTKAHRTNAEYTKERLDAGALRREDQLLLFDPQTSGGLLLSVDSGAASGILAAIRGRFPRAAIVGEVLPADSDAAVRVDG